MHIIYNQELFDSKAQSIVENAQINDAKVKESSCEVYEVSIVCSEQEIPAEHKLTIVVQPV